MRQRWLPAPWQAWSCRHIRTGWPGSTGHHPWCYIRGPLQHSRPGVPRTSQQGIWRGFPWQRQLLDPTLDRTCLLCHTSIRSGLPAWYGMGASACVPISHARLHNIARAVRTCSMPTAMYDYTKWGRVKRQTLPRPRTARNATQVPAAVPGSRVLLRTR